MSGVICPYCMSPLQNGRVAKIPEGDRLRSALVCEPCWEFLTERELRGEPIPPPVGREER